MKTRKFITTCFIYFFLLLCTRQVHAQADSTVNLEELVDPTNMIPPGITAFLSGTSLYLTSIGYSEIINDIYLYYDERDVSMSMFFDPKTIAMRVEFEDKIILKIDSANTGVGYFGGYHINSKPVGKVKQSPMYFDNAGYVYTGTKKDGYVKVPFEKLSKLMPGQGFLSGVTGLPSIGYPDGSVTYYGMDVSPKKFPILEWVFVYKTAVFEGNASFTKEILNCGTGQNCVKYTLTSGADAGSYVLFDSKQRLREISTKGDGYIIFTYQDVNVKLPAAKDMSAYF